VASKTDDQTMTSTRTSLEKSYTYGLMEGSRPWASLEQTLTFIYKCRIQEPWARAHKQKSKPREVAVSNFTFIPAHVAYGAGKSEIAKDTTKPGALQVEKNKSLHNCSQFRGTVVLTPGRCDCVCPACPAAALVWKGRWVRWVLSTLVRK